MKRTRLIAVAAMACLLALVGTTAWAGGTAPGNNGTIKIDGRPFDKFDPNNEPHVGCGFQLDFYGFDATAHAVATLALQPPSGTSTLFGPGGTFNALERDLKPNNTPGGSGDGFDGLIGFQRGDLQTALVNSGGTIHPIQGWHVKLTVTVTSSLGNDTKSKVFWIQDCAPYPVA